MQSPSRWARPRSSHHRLCLQSAVFLLFLAVCPCLAEPPGKLHTGKTERHRNRTRHKAGDAFPGKGSRKEWRQASEEYNRGVRLSAESKFEQAAESFKKAIAIYRWDYRYFENLGAAYRQMKLLPQAEEATSAAIKLNARRWGPWHNQALIYAQEGKFPDALKAAQTCLSLNPPLVRKEEWERLAQSLKQAIEQKTGD
jgi:predicted Zn-dependent protease